MNVEKIINQIVDEAHKNGIKPSTIPYMCVFAYVKKGRVELKNRVIPTVLTLEKMASFVGLEVDVIIKSNDNEDENS